MNDIRTIIFDIGGVVVQTIDHRGRIHWEKRLGLPPGGAEYVVMNSEMGTRAQLGEITNEELWQWVGKHLNLAHQLEPFRRDFWAGDRVNRPTMEIIRGLRPQYSTAVISNASDALNTRLQDKYAIADAFDMIVGSAYEGIMKPEPEIYLRALDRLSVGPEQSVFIDDSAANITTARQLGMHGIHFIPGLDLLDELAELQVTIDG